MISHRLPVDVKAGLVVLNEIALVDEVLKVLTATRIDLFIVRISLGWKSDFWLVDVEETHGVAISHRTRLFGVESVIGRANHLVTVLLIGKETFESSNFNHFALVVVSLSFFSEIRF